MDHVIFPMNNLPEFKIQNTRRTTEKGAEYIIFFEYHFPTTFIKYFDIGVINVVEINLENKKSISIFVKEWLREDQVLDAISLCCQKMIENHHFFIDPIIGLLLIEKNRASNPIEVPKPNKRSIEDISMDIKLAEKKLQDALSSEDYIVAARYRDKLIKLNEEKSFT